MDTIWVALMSGSFALLGSGITAWSNYKQNKISSDERIKTNKNNQREKYREILLPEKLKAYNTINNELKKVSEEIPDMIVKKMALNHINCLIITKLLNAIHNNFLLMPQELRIEISNRINAFNDSFSGALKVDYPSYQNNVSTLIGGIMALLYEDLGANELAAKPLHLLKEN